MNPNHNNLEPGRMDNSDASQPVRYTNIIWVISILIVIIIVLLAFILCERVLEAKVIKVFIDFAVTLLSITLSIFAIAFTYTSNNSVQRQFDKIDYASRSINESSQSLQNSEKELTSLLNQLHTRISKMETDMSFIKENISNNIPTNQSKDLSKAKENLINGNLT